MRQVVTEQRCVTGKPHKFIDIAESRQANHSWCPACGTYKREPFDEEEEIAIPTYLSRANND